MRTVKVMSIIAIVVFSFSFLCLVGFSNNIEDYEAAIGWGWRVTTTPPPALGSRSTPALS